MSFIVKPHRRMGATPFVASAGEAECERASFVPAAAAYVTCHMHTVDGHDLARIHVQPSGFPVDATVTIVRKGRLEEKTAYYVRVNNGTVELEDDEKQKYVASHWATGP